MRDRRENKDGVGLICDPYHPVLNRCLGQDVFIDIVEVVVEAEERVRQVIEIGLDDVPHVGALLRYVIRPDAGEGIQDEDLRNVVPAGEDMAQARRVRRKLIIVLPPSVMIELGRRPIAFALAFDGIVIPVIVEEIHAEDVLPVQNPFHALEGAIPIRPTHRFAQQPGAAEMVGGGACDLKRHVLIRFLFRSDLRVEMVHSDEVHVLQMLEDVPFAPGVHTNPFFEKKMAREDHAVVVAPVAQPLVVALRILLGQCSPEVVPNPSRLFPHACIKGWKERTEIVSAAVSKDFEHAL